ncbi:MAG TPA: hypothetical protein VII63_02725 [Caulobacteraceae bacterium]
MRNFMARFASDESGATRAQYAWIVFLAAFVIIGAQLDGPSL